MSFNSRLLLRRIDLMCLIQHYCALAVLIVSLSINANYRQRQFC